jgi:hypothetical protein
MLPTVLSRCLQFNLRPMAPETVPSTCSRCSRRGSRRTTPARCGCSRARARLDARRALAHRPGHRLRWRPLARPACGRCSAASDRSHVPR